MELKDPVPWLYLQIAGEDLEEKATEDGDAKPSLLWATGAVLLSASFALTLACGPPDDGTAVVPMAVVTRADGSCKIDSGDPGVAGGDPKDDPCATATGANEKSDNSSAACKPDGIAVTGGGVDSCTTSGLGDGKGGSGTSGTGKMTDDSKSHDSTGTAKGNQDDTSSGQDSKADDSMSDSSHDGGPKKGDSGANPGPGSGSNSGPG